MEALLSPLRYPGGKRALLPAIEARVKEHPTKLFVEPFAGGASASFHLLATGAVGRAIIADADPLVAAFWQAATTRPAELIEAIQQELVTLARLDYWRATEPTGTLSRAVRALFLNRTSFSGVLHNCAPPLGGRAQAGKVKIDARWYLTTVARRIEAVGQLAAAGRLEA